VIYLPIGNYKILFEPVYNSPGDIWSDADITKLLSFRNKPVLAGDPSAKHEFWNSSVSNTSGKKNFCNLLM
jgi:hypothetical protein